MLELTNALRKQIASLAKAKYRLEYGLFAVEGVKCVADTLDHFDCRWLLATSEWLAANSPALPPDKIIKVKNNDLERMSSLSTPQGVMAVYNIPPETPMPDPRKQLILALDRIQDPGNLGTIIRLCDWFGVRDILASPNTVDQYSPKVIQATMGAISRVKVHYCDLVGTFRHWHHEVPIYGTALDGQNIYESTLTQNGIIVMGNEGQGISSAVNDTLSHRLLIPPYPAGSVTSESLNVAMATAITLAEFRRRSR